MTTKLTVAEVGEILSEGLPLELAVINTAWLMQIHAMLKDGGIWGWPDGDRVFQKNGDGFIEVTPE